MGKGNVLKASESARLYSWCELNRAEVASTTARKAAESATRALGFIVTESNLSSVRRALGITRPKPDPAGCGCEKALAELRRDLATVTRYVLDWTNNPTYRYDLEKIAGVVKQPPLAGIEHPAGEPKWIIVRNGTEPAS